MRSGKIIELEEGWEHIKNGFETVTKILKGDKIKFTEEEWMNIYTTVYDMCTQKPPNDYSEQLYDRYKQIQEGYLELTVIPSLKTQHGEFMLRELADRWANHKVMVRWLSRFFHYIDRYYIARRSLEPLVDCGRNTFKNKAYDEMKVNARDSLIELIDRERDGEQIDKQPMKLMVNVFDEIGTRRVDDGPEVECYVHDFEAHMVADSGEYYSRKASNWIVEDSCPEYMKKAEESLKKEKERVKNYLRTSTETKLLERVQKELLVVHMQQLLEKEDSGCRALLRGDKEEDLSRMFKLYHEENNSLHKGLNLVAAMFKEHVTDAGKALVQQAEEAVAASGGKKAAAGEEEPGDVLIRKLIELHEKYMGYVIGCFQNHSLFHKALKEAFDLFCNKKVAGSTSAELLAAFLDKILKDVGKSSINDDQDLEKTLDNIVQLLTYVSDKDLFAEFSRKKLGRRLLFDRANEDHEKAILVKLKQQNGGQFTSKMDGMITDITVSKSSQPDFAEYLKKNEGLKPGLDFTVTVLTTGFWPSYSSCDINLPEEMVKCVEAYKGFYDSSKKHRKLSWIYSLGSCHVKGNFVPKPIELIVTTYQAAILLLFNDAESLSFSEILTQSNLTKNDLIRLLHSLSCAKYKILLKEPNTKTINEKDTFMFNTKFTDKMRRIKVPLPPVDERKKVVEDVDKDRRFAIDAALVRIMKSRKVLGHQQLVQECIDILKAMFKPDIKAIKKRIEDLITRDYLERDLENPNTFKYLA